MSDLISRKELLQRTVYNPCHAPYITKQDVIDCPTAEPKVRLIAQINATEPKVGEWIETSEGTLCSNCHKFPYDDGEYHVANWHSDFCPNCGAKMGENR